jgi:Zn-dependent peptidase ImmA (M78 family)/DNA-binding transcriptional regulator YiaG
VLSVTLTLRGEVRGDVATSERIAVAPAVLKWARRTAGFDVDDAAKRLRVSSAQLQEWESGVRRPTIGQLRNMGKLYKRPLVVLLLPEPPRDFDALRDFRRTGQTAGAAAWSPALHAEFKRALSQRDVVLELVELAPSALPGESRRFSFVRAGGDEDAAGRIRELLDMEGWLPGTWGDPRLALRSAIDAVERLGILVLQTRDVEVAEMRGFSVSEWPYPVVVLNGSDWPRPRLFTLLHELCHLGLNAGGLCDLHEQPEGKRRDEDDVERHCNRVAAAALMPRSAMLADPAVRRAGVDGWSLDDLAALGSRYGASSEAVLLRLVSLGLADWELYRERKPELEREYARAREREKERQRGTGGGPSYYRIKVRNLGRSYVQSVIDAFQARVISSFDVADYLDIRFDQLSKLEEAVS